MTSVLRGDARVLSRLLSLLLVVYLLTMAGRLTSGDGETVYQTTKALVTRGSIAVPARPETALGRDGLFYGKYGLGQSIVQAPFVAGGLVAGKLFGAVDDRPARFAVGMTNSVVTVALAAVFWLTCRMLGSSRRTATAATLILSLATLVWPYARADFSEPLQALTLLTVFAGFFRWWRRPAIRWAAIAGAAAGLSFLTKPAAAVPLLPLAVYFCFALWQRRALGGRQLSASVLAAALPVIGCLLFQVMLNLYRFGRTTEFGYGDEPSVGFITPVLLGVQYLLFSSGKGLSLFAPPAIAGLALLPFLARRHLAEAMVIAGVFLIQLLYYARWWAWHGDWSWGPRYMVVTVPFILLALTALGHNNRRWPVPLRMLLASLVVAGVLVSFLGVIIDYGNYYSVVSSQIRRGVDVEEARLVPPFSPILGHAWLARATLYDTVASLQNDGAPRDPEGNLALSQYPWAGQFPAYVPEAPERALGFDLWFLALRDRSPFVSFWAVLGTMWLNLALVSLSISLWRALRQADAVRGPVAPEPVLYASEMGNVAAWQR